MEIQGFDPSSFEKKWREVWEKEGVYRVDIDTKKQKYYNLWMFPYPSAEGVHVGTIFSSTGSDIWGRYIRMCGKEVFQPMGYDSFGIHSENFALKIGQPPATFTNRAIKNYQRQFQEIGHGYDWSRTVTTSSPDYYHWTQWLFVQLFKAGLAYKKTSGVQWCPGCKTVLADEQVTTPAQAGKWPKQYATLEDVPEGCRVCERCGNEPVRKELAQWFFNITKYADRLLEGLEKIDWSERVVVAQREWIGKKTGINITYPIKGTKETLTCFTTRPDTNFGATFVVVAPEFARDNLLSVVKEVDRAEIEMYITQSLNKSEQQRKSEGKVKTGVFTGLIAINQLNGYEMPIWVSDFVLAGFGTGAVVGVPGHDMRDFEFAQTFGLPVKRVVSVGGQMGEITSETDVQEEEGVMVNSEFLNSMNIHDATVAMMDHLEKQGWGKRVTSYHLRDWLVSRQRYWGAPIPMIYCAKCADDGKGYHTSPDLRSPSPDSGEGRGEVMVGWYPEGQLPVLLPDISDYTPEGNGKGPLANHPEFYKTTCPGCGGEAVRETDVMDAFVDSAWYFLRYPNVGNNTAAWSAVVEKTWLPVDQYFGGAEHSVLHLMYARFMTMALHDLGLLDFDEPFPRFFAHGLMIKDGAKMSKSKGNVVNPDEYIAKYGADALRLYLMFMGPIDGYPDFRDSGIEGMTRWLKRVWKMLVGRSEDQNIGKSDSRVDSALHQLVKLVTEDIEEFKFNTAIAEMMKFVNFVEDKELLLNSEQKVTFIKLLAPYAPHICEELFQYLRSKIEDLRSTFESVHRAAWPVADESKISAENKTIVVQVGGKVRGTLALSAEYASDQATVEAAALKLENVAKFVGGATYKTIFVPGRIVNFIVQ